MRSAEIRCEKEGRRDTEGVRSTLRGGQRQQEKLRLGQRGRGSDSCQERAKDTEDHTAGKGQVSEGAERLGGRAV